MQHLLQHNKLMYPASLKPGDKLLTAAAPPAAAAAAAAADPEGAATAVHAPHRRDSHQLSCC
jgi:hypothetical protein